jgi:hypothetical protein
MRRREGYGETANPCGCKPEQGEQAARRPPGYGAELNAAMNRRRLTPPTHNLRFARIFSCIFHAVLYLRSLSFTRETQLFLDYLKYHYVTNEVVMQQSSNSRQTAQWVFTLIAWIALAALVVPAPALNLSTSNLPATPPTIPQGDPVFVNGIATGHPQQGLTVWLIGNNYAKVTTISVNQDNSFEFELKPAETRTLASGQYFVLVQHPMMNGEFDITYNAGTGEVVRRQTGRDMAIFRLTGAGSLQGSDAASALVRAVDSQNIDDTFTTVSFFIQPPNAFIDPIGDHAVGDRFTIGGSTNLAAGDDLLIEVYSSSFRPSSKAQSGEFSGSTGIVKVRQGSGGYNRWSFDLDTATWKPDEYIVTVAAVLQDVKGSATFSVTEKKVPSPTVPATVAMTTLPPATTVTTAPAPMTQKTPLFIFTIPLGFLCAFLILRSSREKV